MCLVLLPPTQKKKEKKKEYPTKNRKEKEILQRRKAVVQAKRLELFFICAYWLIFLSVDEKCNGNTSNVRKEERPKPNIENAPKRLKGKRWS